MSEVISCSVLMSTTNKATSSEESEFNIKDCNKSVVLKRDDSICYSMFHRPRGYCIIFSKYENIKTNIELNWKRETNRLAGVFQTLHFLVHIHYNLSENEITSMSESYAKNEELSDHDSIIIIYLSYGNKGSDVEDQGFEYIVEKFNNQNCPALLGKPKLFFFSCCDGNDIDNTNHLDTNVKDNVVLTKPNERASWVKRRVPKGTDIMIYYSAVENGLDYESSNGSWFGTALVESIEQNAHDKDLLYILVQISNKLNKLSKGTGRFVRQNAVFDLYGFAKFFYFNPGYFK